MVGPAAKREAVAHLRTLMGLSERRACQIVAVDRTTVRYASKRPEDTELREKLRELPTHVGVSDIDGYLSCCDRKVSALA